MASSKYLSFNTTLPLLSSSPYSGNKNYAISTRTPHPYWIRFFSFHLILSDKTWCTNTTAATAPYR